MRTDYKIGIVAVVLLGVVITTWTALNSGPDPQPDADEHAALPLDPNPGNTTADRGSLGDENYFRRRSEDRMAESYSGGIIGERNATKDATLQAGDTLTDGSGESLGDSAHEADLAAARRAAVLARLQGGTDDSPGGSDWLSGAGRAGDAGRTTDPQAETTIYTVKEGDAGFWAVAVKAYGQGKHWALIAKANPDAVSDRLRAGQYLKIPPLPATTRRPGTGPRAPDRQLSGQLVTGTDGKRYYHVQKGDAGFWAVSVKAYGHGKHWALIAKANPNAVSADLKEGQKLLVPPRPVAAAARGPAPGLARTLNRGDTWYTVVEGDVGFWDVAKKKYGNGKHWEVIARANPNVKSTELHKGQKILVPPLPTATRRTAPAPARRVSYGDVPVFDE